jgi:hypothetical protein
MIRSSTGHRFPAYIDPLSVSHGVAAFRLAIVNACVSYKMGYGEWFGIGIESTDSGVVGIGEGGGVLGLVEKGSEENPREPGVGV